MSEVPNLDAKREINEAETAYFVEILGQLEPFLATLPPFEAESIDTPDARSDYDVANRYEEALFVFGDKRIQVNRHSMSSTIDGSEDFETTVWTIHVHGAFDHDADGLSYGVVEDYSVTCENGRADYPTYRKCHLGVNASTGEVKEMRPALDESTLRTLREEPDIGRQIEILTELTDQQEARVRNLEVLTGIDSGRTFTPERLYEAVELLRSLQAEHHSDSFL